MTISLKKMSGRLKTWLRYPSLTDLARDGRVMEAAKNLVSYYYYFLPLLAYLFLIGTSVSKQNFEPFGPLNLLSYFSLDYEAILNTTRLFFAVVSLLAVFLHRSRFVRVLVFIALLYVHALESSFGNVNHQWYLWVYTSFLFIFLPDIEGAEAASHERNRKFLLFVWAAQATVMLMYTMAGLNKFLGVYFQFMRGEIHGFSVENLAYQAANWIPQLQYEAFLARYVIEQPLWGWLPYIAVHFIQLFALWVMVRVSLQKIWAWALLVSHFAIYLTMGINFLPLIPLLMVLFFLSPFCKPMTVREVLYDLPVLGDVSRLIERRWKAVR